VSFGVLGVPVAATAFGLIAAAVPIAIDSSRGHARAAALSAVWPDFLTVVRTRIAAGETLPEAFVEATRHGPPVLQRHGERVDDAVHYGEGFARALEAMQAELADPTADRVLTTLVTAHRSGGHRVGDIVSALATSVADEHRLRKAHDSALTEQRLTAAVALVAPWGLLALTLMTNPQAAQAYRTRVGAVVVAAGLLATGVGFFSARRTIRLSNAPRVFE
jgi:tight adherence protein B